MQLFVYHCVTEKDDVLKLANGGRNHTVLAAIVEVKHTGSVDSRATFVTEVNAGNRYTRPTSGFIL